MGRSNSAWRHGDPIVGTACPQCGSEITYNGNYFCLNCDWALPHPIELIKDQKAYQTALTLLLAMRGETPSQRSLDCTD